MSVHYMAVLGSKWVIKRGACACETVDGSPTPSRIGAKVMSMMKGLGIEDRVVSVTSGSSPGLSGAIGKHTSRSIESIGCASSKIERAVRAFAREPCVARTIGLFQRAAAQLHHCSQTREDFEAAQRVRALRPSATFPPVPLVTSPLVFARDGCRGVGGRFCSNVVENSSSPPMKEGMAVR